MSSIDIKTVVLKIEDTIKKLGLDKPYSGKPFISSFSRGVRSLSYTIMSTGTSIMFIRYGYCYEDPRVGNKLTDELRDCLGLGQPFYVLICNILGYDTNSELLDKADKTVDIGYISGVLL